MVLKRNLRYFDSLRFVGLGPLVSLYLICRVLHHLHFPFSLFPFPFPRQISKARVSSRIIASSSVVELNASVKLKEEPNISYMINQRWPAR